MHLPFFHGCWTQFYAYFFFISLFSDEEKVGPWIRGPLFLFGEETLQRLRVHKVIEFNNSGFGHDWSVHPASPAAQLLLEFEHSFAFITAPEGRF